MNSEKCKVHSEFFIFHGIFCIDFLLKISKLFLEDTNPNESEKKVFFSHKATTKERS